MLKISSTPIVGAIAYGRSGVGHPVTRLEGESVVLQISNGLLRVPWTSIQRWELPTPKPLNVGDTVRLKTTIQNYRLVRVYEILRGMNDAGEPNFEHWAELEGLSGIAHWKVQQLEAM